MKQLNTWSFQVLACVLLLARGGVAQAEPPTVLPVDDDTFPTMYTEWEAKIEGALMGQNYSLSRWEIYSPTHDRLRVHYGPTWDRQVSIEHLDEGFKYRVAKNATYPTGVCWTEPLQTWEQNFYISANHAKSTSELFNYSPKSEKKLNITGHTVRGITCDAWERDVEIRNKTYTVQHHFVSNDWKVIEEFSMTEKNLTSPRPLARMVVKHHDDPTQVDSWDFVGMKPYTYHYGDFDPCNMFGAVKGCGCDMPFRNLTDPRDVQADTAPPLPQVYSDWSASVEETFSVKNHSFTRQEIFSQSKKQMRIDWGVGADKHILIENFETKLKYRIARNATFPAGMCWKINGTDMTDTNYFYEEDHSTLRSTEWLLGYQADEETYVTGDHFVRGMPVDVWKRKLTLFNTSFFIYHAFAEDDWDVSSYYERPSADTVQHPSKRPLARIALSWENDTSIGYTFDYVGMQPYEYDASDFNPCTALGGASMKGCGCEDPGEDPQTGGGSSSNPVKFPGLLVDWSSSVETIHLEEGYNSYRREVSSGTFNKVRIDAGYHDELGTVILETGGSLKTWFVKRNSTYPKGHCRIFYRKDSMRPDGDAITTQELLRYLKHDADLDEHVYLEGDFSVRGIPADLFKSEITLRGRAFHMHLYFAKQAWQNYWGSEGGELTASHLHHNQRLLRIELMDKTKTTSSMYFDFVDMQPYAYRSDDFDPCKISDGVQGCGCEDPIRDLCNSLTKEEVGGLAAGLFFLGFLMATLITCVYLKFTRGKRSSALSYAKYDGNGL